MFDAKHESGHIYGIDCWKLRPLLKDLTSHQRPAP